MSTLQTYVQQSSPDNWNFEELFSKQYLQEFGFVLQSRIKVDDIRIRAIGKSEFGEAQSCVQEECRKLKRRTDAVPSSVSSVYFSPDGRIETPIFLLGNLLLGHVVNGPALIIDKNATIVISPDCTALITSQHVVITG